MLEQLKRKFIYKHSTKPECYVHVDKAKTLQEKRQVQYNNWCKRYSVYNGSYLPEEPTTLLKKGWTDRKPTGGKIGKETYQRKSSGQKVRYDEEKPNKYGIIEDKHYHWFNQNKDKTNSQTKRDTNYIDKYGNVCAEKTPESHLAPKDRKFIMK